MELRCPNKKHGVLIVPTEEEGVVEMQCDSRWCGSVPGVVVMHRFSTHSGAVVATNRYKRPPMGG